MRAIRSVGMKPELLVRRLVHGMGYRFRLHRKDLPGRPDLVFPSRRKAIFVHGCFWHQHPDESCKDSRLPKSNGAYWLPKLRRNVERDAAAITSLRRAGWKTLVLWECELRAADKVAIRLRRFLGP